MRGAQCILNDYCVEGQTHWIFTRTNYFLQMKTVVRLNKSDTSVFRILIFAVSFTIAFMFHEHITNYKPPKAIQVWNCQQTMGLDPFERSCLVYNKATLLNGKSIKQCSEWISFFILFIPTDDDNSILLM